MVKNQRRKKWFIDQEDDKRWVFHRIKKNILSSVTPFQKIELIDTDKYGRVIILDEKIQSAEADEFIYHEALVHPALLTHPSPRNVLVLGAGEGATVREVIKHPSVKKVIMVDIDREFVQLCRTRLKKWSKGAFDDPRVTLVFDDALQYVRMEKSSFDIIIADISDPGDSGPSKLLYSRDFYARLKNLLSPGGLFVTHVTELSYIAPGKISTEIYKTLAGLFPHAFLYFEYIPSFSALWAFAIASLQHNPAKLSPSLLNKRLKDRNLHDLSYYDAETHRRLFCLPKCVRKLLKTD